MKSFILSIMLVLPLMSLADEANSEAVSAAQAAAIEWLSLTDQGQFELSWDKAAPLFQAGVTKSDWQRSLNAVRLPLITLQMSPRWQILTNNGRILADTISDPLLLTKTTE